MSDSSGFFLYYVDENRFIVVNPHLACRLQFVFVKLFGCVVAQGLHCLYHDDEHDNGGNHNIHLEALVAVADCQVTKTAAA